MVETLQAETELTSKQLRVVTAAVRKVTADDAVFLARTAARGARIGTDVMTLRVDLIVLALVLTLVALLAKHPEVIVMPGTQEERSTQSTGDNQ